MPQASGPSARRGAFDLVAEPVKSFEILLLKILDREGKGLLREGQGKLRGETDTISLQFGIQNTGVREIPRIPHAVIRHPQTINESLLSRKAGDAFPGLFLDDLVAAV